MPITSSVNSAFGENDGLNTMRVTKTGNKMNFKGHFSGFSMVDADTNQYIIYLPALEVTSYGESLEKADEMMKATVEDFFNYLSRMTHKQFESELQKLDWKKDKFKNKEFSKCFVDPQGELKNFNISEGSLKSLSLAL